MVEAAAPDKTQERGEIRVGVARTKAEWGKSVAVDRTPDDLDMNSYDALLPGGVINPDKLRLEPKVIEMVRRFATAEAQWSDQEVGTDDGIITSRSPKDIPAFVDKIIEELGEGRQDVRRVAAGTNPR